MGKTKGARLAEDLSRLAEKHGYSEEADEDVGVLRFLHTLVTTQSDQILNLRKLSSGLKRRLRLADKKGEG